MEATTCLSMGAKTRTGYKSRSRSPAGSTVKSNTRILIVGQSAVTSRRLAELVKIAGYRTVTFETASELRSSPHLHPPCCVLLEHDSAQPNGFDLEQELVYYFKLIPVIVLSKNSSLEAGIAAMKAGAVDYIIQPPAPAVIAAAIKTALAKQVKDCELNKCSFKFRQAWQTLTIREREVLSFIIDGYLNKQIAAELGISEKTIKVHRGRVMKKMQVASFAELVRLAERASIAGNFSDGRFSTEIKFPTNGERHLQSSTAHDGPAPNCWL